MRRQKDCKKVLYMFQLFASFICPHSLHSVPKTEQNNDTDYFETFNCVPCIDCSLPMTSSIKNSLTLPGAFFPPECSPGQVGMWKWVEYSGKVELGWYLALKCPCPLDQLSHSCFVKYQFNVSGNTTLTLHFTLFHWFSKLGFQKSRLPLC